LTQVEFRGGLLLVCLSVCLSVLSYLRSLPLQDGETGVISFMCFLKFDSDPTDSTMFLISGIYRLI